MRSVPRLYSESRRSELVVAMSNCEMIVSRQRTKHESGRIFIIRNRYLETSSEEFMVAAVQWLVECVDPWNCYSYKLWE
jgi:hypothetical protein